MRYDLDHHVAVDFDCGRHCHYSHLLRLEWTGLTIVCTVPDVLTRGQGRTNSRFANVLPKESWCHLPVLTHRSGYRSTLPHLAMGAASNFEVSALEAGRYCAKPPGHPVHRFSHSHWT